jgi:hypothetical protein
MSKAFVALLSIVVLMSTVVLLARSIEPVTTTTTVWVQATIPRSTTTIVGLPKPLIRSFTFIEEEPPELSLSELCALAEASPSPEGLTEALFVWGYEHLNGDKRDLYVTYTGSLIWTAHDTGACTGRAAQLIEEMLPFLEATEG